MNTISMTLGVLLMGFVAATSAQTMPTYVVEPVGAKPPGLKTPTSVLINDINSAGTTAGTMFHRRRGTAFTWSPGAAPHRLADLPGGATDAGAAAINEAGDIAGYATSALGRRAALFDADGTIEDLGAFLPAGVQSSAAGLNDARQVIGTYGSGAAHTNAAFRWSAADGVQAIADLPGGFDDARPQDINATGAVVGLGSISDVIDHAFYWSPATGTIDIGTLPLHKGSAFAFGINDAGQVVGASDNTAFIHSFIWTLAGGMQQLPSLPSLFSTTYANKINNHGVIVGGSLRDIDGTTAFRACAWYPDGSGGHTIVDLNDVVTGLGDVQLEEAVAVSDAGQIIARAVKVVGNPQLGFRSIAYTLVLTPKP